MGLLTSISAAVFVGFQSQHIVAGDSGDLVTAAATFGIPHPPGYPLYTYIGWLIHHGMPIGSAAWHVGFLSSIPHALVIGIAAYVVWRLTHDWIGAAAAAFSLIINYVFFLYSTTPEVFALFDLFLVTLLLVAVLWEQTNASVLLNIGAFLFGVSLTHHHLIVFLVPALGYLLWDKRRALKHTGTPRFFMLLCLWVAVGLLPYAYVAIAAHASSLINWDRPTTLARFIQLVTRADYGTFRSAPVLGSLLVQRWMSVVAYVQFLLLDWTWAGMFLSFIGLWGVWRKNRRVAIFFTLAWLFLGPLFFFYASFPLINRFTLGTYERFLLPSYVLLAILLGVGLIEGMATVRALAQKYLHAPSVRLLAVWGVVGAYALFASAQGYVTLWRFAGLPQDTTAERLGYDILSTVPPNAMLLLARDTPLFTTQYVRYALGVRPDVFVVHLGSLYAPSYRETLQAAFPSLIYPSSPDEHFAGSFVLANMATHPVYSNTSFPIEGEWYWIPEGLLYRLTDKDHLPPVDTLLASNAKLWSIYQKPQDGILKRYNHLMLADVKDVYAVANVEFGKVLLKGGYNKEAKEQFDHAIALDGDTMNAEAATYIGLAALELKQCDEALAAFRRARNASVVPSPDLLLYEATTYRDCVGDVDRGTALFEQYQQQKKSSEMPLAPPR